MRIPNADLDQMNDRSFLGKKPAISNRLKKMVTTANKAECEKLVDEVKPILNGLYHILNTNNNKLIQIDRVLSKDTA